MSTKNMKFINIQARGLKLNRTVKNNDKTFSFGGIQVSNTSMSIISSRPGGGHSLIWPIRGRAAGQGMVFGLLCPEQGILFYANLS